MDWESPRIERGNYDEDTIDEFGERRSDSSDWQSVMDTFALTDIAVQWWQSLVGAVVRYATFAIGTWLLLWVLLEARLRRLRIRSRKPPTRQLLVEFAVSLRSMAVFTTVGLSMVLLSRAGLMPGPGIAVRYGRAWASVSFLLMVVGHDTYFYWTHRAMHDPRLFRWFHERHHRSHNPSPFTAYSFKMTEAAIQAAFVPLWMTAVPTTWAVGGLFMLHQIARNTLGHGGYELFPAGRDDRPLLDFLTTVTHHDLHHTSPHWNYGLYFTWWDRLMGTEHPEYHVRYAAVARRCRGGPAEAEDAQALPIRRVS